MLQKQSLLPPAYTLQLQWPPLSVSGGPSILMSTDRSWAETGTKTDATTNIHFAVTVVGQAWRAGEGRLLARLSGRVADQEVVRRLDATVIDAALDLEQPSFAPAGTPGIPEQPGSRKAS